MELYPRFRLTVNKSMETSFNISYSEAMKMPESHVRMYNRVLDDIDERKLTKDFDDGPD